MKINANMSAVLTNNQLLRTENKLRASMERLSSGLKLNSAEDNPAGMAISNKMKAQIDALDQAEDNATDAISVLQIADGALSEVHSMLQRIRELTVQAANGTNSDNDRQSIQDEINQLVKEVDRISRDTEYNTKNLLDGSSDVRTYASHASRVQVSDYVPAGEYSLTVSKAAEPAVAALVLDGSNGIDRTGSAALGMTGTVEINHCEIEINPSMSGAEIYEALRQGLEKSGVELNPDGTLRTEDTGTEASISFKSDSLELAVALTGKTKAEVEASYDTEKNEYQVFTEYGSDVEIDLTTPASKFSGTATATSQGNRVTITDINGFSIDFLLEDGYEYEQDPGTGDVIRDGVVTFDVTEIGSMTVQLGANEYQTMDVRIPEISEKSLYLDTVDVVKYYGAEKAMKTLDDAIAEVSSTRSRIGASQNRLEYAVSSLAENQENMTSAFSTLKDTDMAEEMTEYTQQTVLDQAAISVLSQANQIPQQVLSLLG